MQGRSKFYPGETTQVDESIPGRSRVAYRGPPREPGITREDVIEIVEEAMKYVGEDVLRDLPRDISSYFLRESP